MPSADDMDKKPGERQIIECFCGALGAPVVAISMTESPDAFACLEGKGWPPKVGIELRRYHSDPTAGKGSRGMRQRGGWLALEKTLQDAPKPALLRDIDVSVAPKSDSPPPNEEWPSLVQQVIGFALDIVSDDQWPGRSLHSSFCPHTYPLLDVHVHSILVLRRGTRGSWVCQGRTGWAGLNRTGLLEIISEKSRKAKGFQWSDAAERWLLVAAGADPTVPATKLGANELLSHGLQGIEARCAKERLAFDRVFLYEHSYRWWHCVWKGPKVPELPT